MESQNTRQENIALYVVIYQGRAVQDVDKRLDEAREDPQHGDTAFLDFKERLQGFTVAADAKL